ncbi:Hsp70 family protein [Uliginosibacterium sp. sgz301328]|uniref:Hsp70 family protein n=1 Tax=Uliginosibacterium sp. sgz301328 TaxID=3243764 RepID=UPI00359EB396
MSIAACGIDFGTSNSTAAVHTPDGPRLIALEDGRPTLPSAVFFNLDEERQTYGRAAIAEYLEGYEGRLMRSMKSLLGSGLMEAGTEIGGRLLPFRALVGDFIGTIKHRTEAACGHACDAVVVGRPVRFVDEDDAADRLAQDTLEQIVRGLGFAEVSFQFEPIAAAHAYEQDITREELVLIVDIGGGTSDFSLVRLSPERRALADRSADLLGNTGVHIGGTDFDKRLSLACVMPELGLGDTLRNGAPIPNSVYYLLATWHTINQAYQGKVWSGFQEIARNLAEPRRFERLLNVIRKQAGHQLAMQVEAGKIDLSAADLSTLALDEAEDGLRIALKRGEFEAAIAGEIERIGVAAETCLAQAGVAPSRIDTLFFTGGSSAVPALRQGLAQRFPAARAVEGDLYGSVGCGLAVVAGQRYG